VKKERLLIVDDDLHFRSVFREMIHAKRPDFEILESNTVHGAIARARRNRPGLIILDIDMTADNRLQPIRDIKSSCPDAPILVLSGNDAIEYEQAARQCGADHFLSKFSSSGKQIIEKIEAVFEENSNCGMAKRQKYKA
jgi:DNA-binding NarL/FixJ family response regulator